MKPSLPLAKRSEFFAVPRSVMSGRIAAALILGEILLGITGFMYLQGFKFTQALYMTIITISTVGYGEVKPLTEGGELFASFLIILNFGIFAYVLSVFSYYVINGEIFKKMHSAIIRKNIDQLENHVILCGFGRYGKEVSQNFLHHNTPFVVVENNPAVIEEIQKGEDKILYIQDDATHDETLQHAGIKKAKSLITALPDDSDNLFIVLTARQLNPKISIISRTSSYRSQRKLQLAGADYVIMPEQIGGFYMATLVSKPGATEFFSYITREAESDIEFEELHYNSMPPSGKGKSIKDLHIRNRTGTNIIAFKDPKGNYVVNPNPETVLVENSSFIVLGTREQLETLRLYLSQMR